MNILIKMCFFFCSKIIDFVRDPYGGTWEGYGYAIGLFTVSMVALIFKAHVNYIFKVTGLRVKSALMNAVYRKSLLLSRSSSSGTKDLKLLKAL